MSSNIKLNNLLFWAAMGLFVLGTYSCSEPASPFGQAEITLTTLDASCTEAWFELKFSNLAQPANVAIQKDGKDFQRLLSLNRDTLLIFENLEPSTNYSFRAIIRHEGKDDKISNTVQVRTMDTTNHNFTWQTFTFGEHSSSSLYDVAIINENNIWAVGEIYMNDSLGNPDPNAYNAVHWDGSKWDLLKLQFFDFCGNPSTGSYPTRAITTIGENEIYITSGSQITKYDGKRQITTECIPVSVNKLWGKSGSDLYAVGYGGKIAHYNGTSWKKIESGTTVNLFDVCGTPDGNEIWTCGWNNQTGQSVILEIKDIGTEIIWNSQMPQPYFVYSGLLNSLWANGNREFVFVGGQVFRHSLVDKNIVRKEWIKYPNGSKVLELGKYGYSIKGSGKNNMAIVGDASMIWHYNGKSWHKYSELLSDNDRLYSVAVTDNSIGAVGARYGGGPFRKVLLLLGRR